MRTLPLFMFFFASALALAAEPGFDLQADLAARNSQAKAESHCVGEERVVFTCQIGKRVVSVCASAVLDANQGYLQYRFGQLHNVELEIPPKPNYKPSMVGHMDVLLASSYAMYVRFTKGDYRYYVFSASVRGSNDPETGASTREEPSGVAVMKNGKIINTLHCASAPFADNLGAHFLGKAVTTLGFKEDADPFKIAFPKR